MPRIELDAADRRLLQLLQRDARASTQELADAAGLSSSPAWRRLKRLEEAGVIRAQVALLDPRKLGLETLAYVQVILTDHVEATVAKFDAFVRNQGRVLECARIAGGFDYMLKVVCADAADLEEFLMRHLLALGIVRTSSTSIVLRQMKATTELPLD
ncbi:Lrp/AsnC family transcriptional regulator [Rhodobacter sp.]